MSASPFSPFATMSESITRANVKEFGTVPKSTGRYHMPLLSGENGCKGGGDWVPGGVQRVTNLVGAFEETRALNVWEQAMALCGLALSLELHEELVLLVRAAIVDGVILERLREYPDLIDTLAGRPHDAGESIIGRAKRLAGASIAAQKGTNRHTAWEYRGETGELIGTQEIDDHVLLTESLLREAGLERVPGLSERVVRNMEVHAVGKFDDILLSQRTGRLLMSDLKTKARAFFSWMTVDAQEATYATSDWMLTKDRQSYEPGPRALGVDQTEGVILHVPSDGSPAYLRRADLTAGWRVAKLARLVLDERAYGKSAERHRLAEWSEVTV